MGMILLQFRWNEYQQQYGLSELAKPVWDQKLWTGDTVLKAPTVRTAGGVAAAAAAAVVSTVCSWGTLGPVAGALVAGTVSAAIVMTKETAFAIADLAGGYKSWEEVGKNLAMTAITSAVKAGRWKYGSMENILPV